MATSRSTGQHLLAAREILNAGEGDYMDGAGLRLRIGGPVADLASPRERAAAHLSFEEADADPHHRGGNVSAYQQRLDGHSRRGPAGGIRLSRKLTSCPTEA